MFFEAEVYCTINLKQGNWYASPNFIRIGYIVFQMVFRFLGVRCTGLATTLSEKPPPPVQRTLRLLS